MRKILITIWMICIINTLLCIERVTITETPTESAEETTKHDGMIKITKKDGSVEYRQGTTAHLVEPVQIPFPDCYQTNSIDIGFPEKPKDAYEYIIPSDRPIYYKLRDVFFEYWQVPAGILKMMSDEGVIVTYINNPYHMWRHNNTMEVLSMQSFVQQPDNEFLMENCNSLKEIFKRESILPKIVDILINKDFRFPPENEVQYLKYEKKIRILQNIVSRSENLNTLSYQQKVQLLKVLFCNISSRFMYRDEFYHDIEVETRLTYLNDDLALRLLTLSEYKPLLESLKKHDLPKDVYLKQRDKRLLPPKIESQLLEQYATENLIKNKQEE